MIYCKATGFQPSRELKPVPKGCNHFQQAHKTPFSLSFINGPAASSQFPLFQRPAFEVPLGLAGCSFSVSESCQYRD